MKKELLESIQEVPNYLAADLTAPDQPEDRRRDVVFYSGAKVERFDWLSGEIYDLSFSMDGANLAELKDGAPVLNGHQSYSAQDVVGKIVSARRADKGYQAVLQFSSADDVTPVWQRIEEGTLSKVSMGVKIGKLVLKEEDKKARRKHYMATDWTPFEISVVPIGADPGAKFLAADPRLERLRTLSVESGAASEAETNARYELALRERRLRVLGH